VHAVLLEVRVTNLEVAFGVVDLQHAPFLLCCPEFFGTHITTMPFSSKFCTAKKKCASAREKTSRMRFRQLVDCG